MNNLASLARRVARLMLKTGPATEPLDLPPLPNPEDDGPAAQAIVAELDQVKKVLAARYPEQAKTLHGARQVLLNDHLASELLAELLEVRSGLYDPQAVPYGLRELPEGERNGQET